MWSHFCKAEGGWISVEDGERCNWCSRGERRDAPQAPADASRERTWQEVLEKLDRPSVQREAKRQ